MNKILLAVLRNFKTLICNASRAFAWDRDFFKIEENNSGIVENQADGCTDRQRTSIEKMYFFSIQKTVPKYRYVLNSFSICKPSTPLSVLIKVTNLQGKNEQERKRLIEAKRKG